MPVSENDALTAADQDALTAMLRVATIALARGRFFADGREHFDEAQLDLARRLIRDVLLVDPANQTARRLARAWRTLRESSARLDVAFPYMSVDLFDLDEHIEFESGSYDPETQRLMSGNGMQRPGRGSTPGRHRKGGVPGPTSFPPRSRYR